MDQRLRICLQEADPETPSYAILSHTWGDGEVTFRDCYGVQDITENLEIRRMPGYQKIWGCCSQAWRDGFSHVWIDTCCIDKSSSAELSEAINSMYSWYEMSARCYAYLADVCGSEADDHAAELSPFRKSKWFTRGWTLQELLAPTDVVFYDTNWKNVGTKAGLATVISEITRVREEILVDGLHQHDASLAEKMSWAADRQTSREEDRAYSLLGLFDINMPPIYGEGSQAFIRLQEQIMHTTTDHSIFTWQMGSVSMGILASSPDQFLQPVYHPIEYESYTRAFRVGRADMKPDFNPTNYGLHIQLPIAPMKEYPGYFYGFLACSTTGEAETGWAVIYLHRKPGCTTPLFTRTSFEGRWTGTRAETSHFAVSTVFILLHENIWALQWQPEPSAFPPSKICAISSPTNDMERTVTFALAKTHRNIKVASAYMDDYFTTGNEIHMATFNGSWSMKMEFGQPQFPPIEGTVIAKRIQVENIQLGKKKYGDGRHVAAVVVTNGLGTLGNRMLMVFVMRRGAWLLFLARVSDDVTAGFCRQELLRSKKSPEETSTATGLVSRPSWRLSPFVGAGIPFRYEFHSNLRLGRYSVSVEREICLGYNTLAFRITIGLRPKLLPNLDGTLIVNGELIKSMVSQEIEADNIEFS